MATKEKLKYLTRIRVLSGDQIALGPGKVALLEEIERSGSISKAARKLGLSYRRAWTLVDTMNKTFESYLVRGSAGGKKRWGSFSNTAWSKNGKNIPSHGNKSGKSYTRKLENN